VIKQRNFVYLAILLAACLFALTVNGIKKQARAVVDPEIQVALPLFVQVGMAGGDRFLAANMAAIRALITDTSRMQPDQYKILAKVQTDASWLNPAHEDNYFTAAAILPWSGQLGAAQTILYRAAQTRPYDYLPAFLYGFHVFYFLGDPVKAAEWLRVSALKLPDDNQRLTLENIAAKWADKDKNLDSAIGVVTALSKQAKRKDFRAYLEMRVQRLKDLKMLRAKAAIFKERNKRNPSSPDELVSSGLIKSLPKDPFGFGFGMNKDGEIILRTSEPKK
jgi:tetratricopeptide (TPR) repeat protein